SLRFVLGLLTLAAATAQDTMGIFITSQFQGMVGVSLASFFLMRRQPNPYAEDGVADTLKQTQATHQRTPGAPIQAVGPTKWGGFKPPKWAPLSHRKAFELAAARRAAEAASANGEDEAAGSEKAARPRQVAVPIQPYYYRSRKA
ncbi:MAG: hypothetical protein ACKOB0_13475, partial [Chthoniobacterales bacterium]